MITKYVIEKRNPDGSLDLSQPQPEQYFGNAAIHGIDDNAMAQVVWRHTPDAVLDGRNLLLWPSFINPKFVARQKYW